MGKGGGGSNEIKETSQQGEKVKSSFSGWKHL